MASVEPRTISFEELIEQTRKGFLRVPRFQRGFVWRRDQILSLFESIRLRYPIGSLLIWKTSSRYKSFEQIGPVPVPTDTPPQPAEVGYVLDGHQRLTSLFGVFALQDEQAKTLRRSERAFQVYLDLQAQEFVHERHPQPHHLPAWKLLRRDTAVLDFITTHRDKTQRGSSARAAWDRYYHFGMKTTTDFARYRLPFIDVKDASLAEVAEIFTRINSQGTRVSKAEVFAALAWQPDGFDFAQSAHDLLNAHPKYSNFGTAPVLRAILAALGESMYVQSWEGILKAHGDHLPKVMEAVADAYGRAVAFLAEDIGARSGKVTPYALQLVLLTEFFRICSAPSDKTRDALRQWFWASSLSSAYLLGELTQSNAVEAVRKLARGEAHSLLTAGARLRPFPRNFHPKSARVRSVHLFLKALNPRDPSTGEVIPHDRLLSNGMADAVTICGIPGTPIRRRMANRLLVGSGRRRDLKTELIQLRGHPDQEAILDSHAIPVEALERLAADDEEGFVALREQELIRRERIFAADFVELPPLSADATEEEPEVDVIDDSEPDMV